MGNRSTPPSTLWLSFPSLEGWPNGRHSNVWLSDRENESPDRPLGHTVETNFIIHHNQGKWTAPRQQTVRTPDARIVWRGKGCVWVYRTNPVTVYNLGVERRKWPLSAILAYGSAQMSMSWRATWYYGALWLVAPADGSWLESLPRTFLRLGTIQADSSQLQPTSTVPAWLTFWIGSCTRGLGLATASRLVYDV